MPSLSSLFVFLAVVGGAGVVLQALGSLVGIGGDEGPDAHGPDEMHHEPGTSDPGSLLSVFNFRSVRAIATGIGFTGLGGMLALRQFSGPAALALALLLGTTLYLFVAYVMRGFARLEADNTVHPLRAVGLDATVSLPIPALGSGPGKVTLVVGGRRVEWPAVQSESAAPGSVISSGTLVQIVDAADDTTLTVVPVRQSS
jgi:hypothetical protein